MIGGRKPNLETKTVRGTNQKHFAAGVMHAIGCLKGAHPSEVEKIIAALDKTYAKQA